MGELFAAIELTTVAPSIAAMGILIIGITMTFKGVDLAKRAIRKV